MIGPITGQLWKRAGKTGWNCACAGFAPRLKSLPRYDERPAAPAKIVSARPETIWLARRVITRNAWISEVIIPARAATAIAAASATGVLAWKRCTVQKPITAP